MIVTNPLTMSILTKSCMKALLYFSGLPLVYLCIPSFNKYLRSIDDILGTGVVQDTCSIAVDAIKSLRSGSTTNNSFLTSNHETAKRLFDDFTNTVTGTASDTSTKIIPFETQLSAYEKNHSTKVIFINHAYDKESAYGLSFLSKQDRLSLEDAKKFVDTLRTIDNDSHITLIINTPGGSLTASEVIINSLLNHKGKIDVYIPYMCASAGTMIALAADKIYMNNSAFCGPIDPQLNYFSAATIVKYCDSISIDREGSFSIIRDFAELFKLQANSAIDRIAVLIDTIHARKNNLMHKDRIKLELLWGGRNHDEPLFAKDLTDMLPGIIVGIPEDLMNLFESKNRSTNIF